MREKELHGDDLRTFLRTKIFTNCPFSKHFVEDKNDNSFYLEKIREEYGNDFVKIKLTHYENEASRA